ncbi:hypothetical protein NPIL_133501 [Nephila pilipes]|uniref:Uncharacterized protein n=1 Tax=Nephila pilipes TaxID=299642 RepID=A0A8X6MXF5_NEPPI|nr:hypothetical protein NPIL_133501 [Nephila pilipes]
MAKIGSDFNRRLLQTSDRGSEEWVSCRDEEENKVSSSRESWIFDSGSAFSTPLHPGAKNQDNWRFPKRTLCSGLQDPGSLTADWLSGGSRRGGDERAGGGNQGTLAFEEGIQHGEAESVRVWGS